MKMARRHDGYMTFHDITTTENKVTGTTTTVDKQYGMHRFGGGVDVQGFFNLTDTQMQELLDVGETILDEGQG